MSFVKNFFWDLKKYFWSETSLGWFGVEWNENVTLVVTLTRYSLPESNGAV